HGLYFEGINVPLARTQLERPCGANSQAGLMQIVSPMDQAAVRSLTSQLAEDLAWLEDHARKLPEHAPKAGALRLAAALVRNVVNPFLERQTPAPLHVAV